MEIATMFQEFGFPIAIVCVLGAYIAYTLKINREDNLARDEAMRADNNRREEIYRQDSKEREEKLMLQLGEMSATNKILLETNAALAGEINTKLDIIIQSTKE